MTDEMEQLTSKKPERTRLHWAVGWLVGLAALGWLTYSGLYLESEFIREWLPPVIVIFGVLNGIALLNPVVLTRTAWKELLKYHRPQPFIGWRYIDVVIRVVIIGLWATHGFYWTAAAFAAAAAADTVLRQKMAEIWDFYLEKVRQIQALQRQDLESGE